MIAPVVDWSATSATLGFVFVFWHTWHYDRFRSFLFKRPDWFRSVILWVHAVGITFFAISQWMDVHVVYQEAFVKIGQEIRYRPWQLWPQNEQTTYKVSAYLLTVMFWSLQIAHAEEMIFWGYLIRAIRNPNNACAPTPRVWIKAPCFKFWTAISVSTGLLLFGAACIEMEDLEYQRSYLYIVTSGISLLLSFGSFAFVFYLPSFVTRMKDFGAGFEMQERLAVFQEINSIRTLLRVAYATCFMIIGADSLSGTKRIMHNAFASTFLPMLGQSCLIIVFCLSIIVLLPRNMNLESSAPKHDTTFHPMMSAYKRPTPDRLANHHFWEMGQRLNLEQDALAAILPDRHNTGGVAGHAYELSYSTSNHLHAQNQNQALEQAKANANGNGNGQAHMTSEPQSHALEGRRPTTMNGLQEMIGRLKGMDGQRAEMPPVPTQIIVTTHEDKRVD